MEPFITMVSPVQSSDACCPKAHQLSFVVTVSMVCLLFVLLLSNFLLPYVEVCLL